MCIYQMTMIFDIQWNIIVQLQCIYIYVKMLFKLCPGFKKKVVGKFVKDERKCTVKTKDAKLVVHVILNFAIFVIRNKILCFIYLLIKV
jgi:hypothetical protein